VASESKQGIKRASNAGKSMKGKHRKKDWYGGGYDSLSLSARSSDYDHMNSGLSMRGWDRRSGIHDGGGYDFSGITGIGVGYDSVTGIRPKDRRRSRQRTGE
jgi:hypothetical protein